jgi:dipeptidyl aminopeptidase/acylaminoacyl peptidase
MRARPPRPFLALLPSLAALLAWVSPALAAPRPATAKTFSLGHVLAMKQVQGLTWSRDGRRLAFTVVAPDTAENTTLQDVWMWEADTDSCRQLTRHPKNDYAPQFSPGGDTLAFLSTRDNDEGKPSIWFLPLHGGEPWKLATFVESVGEMRWSPDGRSIAFTMLDTIPKRDKEWRKKKWDQIVEDEIPQYNHLWVYDLATARQRRITSGLFMVADPKWSPDSRTIAFNWSPTGRPDDGNLTDIGTVSAEGGAIRKLDAMLDGSFEWSPDGRWIAWAGGADRASHVQKTDLYVAPAAGGRAVNLTAGFDEDADTPSWNPSSDTLFFMSAQHASQRPASVPRAGGAVRLGPDLDGVASAPVAGPGGRVAYVASGWRRPPEVHLADHAATPPRAISRLHADVARCEFGATRTFTWTSDDGVRVEGVLVRPVGASDRGATKTLVLLHGGPYSSRYTIGFQPMAQYMAARGYQVFMPNFRSSGGYGTAFMVRKRADWGGQDWRDVETGVDSLVRAGLADGQRLGVFGHSYGGYLSAWAITHTNRYDASVVSAGAIDLAAHWGQSDIHRYRAYDFQGRPWETDNWKKASPLTFISRVKTPTLVLNGEADPRVPNPQAQMTYQSLKALGVPTQYVRYPREGHSLRETRHRADWYVRQAEWFDLWVK